MSRYARYDLQQGVVLVIVLVFLQLFALLALYSLTETILAQKINTTRWQSVTATFMAEKILHMIEVKLQAEVPACVVPITASGQFIDYPLSWWQSSVACEGELQQFHYYYVIEKLGEDPCAQVKGINAEINAAHYLRVSLFVVGENTGIKKILQSTVIIVSSRLSKCDGAYYPVRPGQQSYLEL